MSIIESLDYNIKAIESFEKQQANLESTLENLQDEISSLERRLVSSKDCKAYYGKAIDILYEKSVGALKDTLNTALQYVVHDKNYGVELILDDKRSTKSLVILLKDLDTDLEVDLKDGVGQGIRTIISFVLKMYYLINKNTEILVLDEKYSALSEEYTARFFEFMQRMCEEKDFIVVIITHDKRFEPFCDRIYQISDGKVVSMRDKTDSK